MAKQASVNDFPAVAEARRKLQGRLDERSALAIKLAAEVNRRAKPQEDRAARQQRLATLAIEKGVSLQHVLAGEEKERRAAQAKADAESLDLAVLEDGVAALDRIIAALRVSVEEEEKKAYRAMVDAVRPEIATLAREWFGAIALAASVDRRMRAFHEAHPFTRGQLPELTLRDKERLAGKGTLSYVELTYEAVQAAVRSGLLKGDEQELLEITRDAREEMKKQTGRAVSPAEIYKP